MKTKKELKQIAKETLMDALAIAYYRLENDYDFDILSELEQKLVYEYLDKYAVAMAKVIGRKYYSL